MLEIPAHAREALGVTPRLPVPRLERMPRRHRVERRRLVVAIIAIIVLAAACSGSHTADRVAPPTTIAASFPSTAPPTASAPPASVSLTVPPSTQPPTTTPPTITTTPVTDASGRVTAVVTNVEGDGNATIPLPPDAGVPAIVHAQYEGRDKFVVTNVDGFGKYLSILAQSAGKYDGTFPLGFVDQHNDPTGGVSVATTGPWQLDIAAAGLAPALPPAGVSGRGDAVLSYTGPKAGAEVIYPGTSTFTIETFANGTVDVLANAVGPYRRRIALPAGPAFISVTAAGNWSIKLG